jgi:tetratricopeptide (TPR) repeat protein
VSVDGIQLLILGLLGGPIAVLIGRPLLAPPSPTQPAGGELDDAVLIRRRIAIEALHDIEIDRRAGSLAADEYRRLRDEAELRAAAAVAELERSAAQPHTARVGTETVAGRRWALGLGGVLGTLLVVGYLLPSPVSLANTTLVNRPLAAALAFGGEREEEIRRLTAQLADDPRNPAVLSRLADLYLAGSSQEDLVRAAYVLLALIELEPADEEAHARIASAYIRAGDYANAAAATDALERLAPASPDVPFFRGLIALRGSGDADAAVEAFDRFLRLAADDQRAPMVRGLRGEAASQLGDQ